MLHRACCAAYCSVALHVAPVVTDAHRPRADVCILGHVARGTSHQLSTGLRAPFFFAHAFCVVCSALCGAYLCVACCRTLVSHRPVRRSGAFVRLPHAVQPTTCNTQHPCKMAAGARPAPQRRMPPVACCPAVVCRMPCVVCPLHIACGTSVCHAATLYITLSAGPAFRAVKTTSPRGRTPHKAHAPSAAPCVRMAWPPLPASPAPRPLCFPT